MCLVIYYMKIENTAIRLNKLMHERNLKQVDIIELAKPYANKYGVKLEKNHLSQYLSGKVEPNQHKLFILGVALNVSEAWLMGYDVPMERGTDRVKDRFIDNTPNTSERTVFAMEGQAGKQTEQVRTDNYEELSELNALLRDMPPEKLKKIAEFVEMMK